ncbi:MAG: hypothetical protein M3388_11240 [Acidobacteriota bacterium]|nr:hypothetical protein [Acidobacteriota bacterium]
MNKRQDFLSEKEEGYEKSYHRKFFGLRLTVLLAGRTSYKRIGQFGIEH